LSKLLLVEGETPTHFFEALAVHLKINETIEIRSFGGNQNFKNGLLALTKSHGFGATVNSLGVVRDAEKDANAARRSLDDAIKDAKLPSQIKVSTFILPDNSKSGLIETLCIDSISAKPHFHCVDEFIENARSFGATFPEGVVLDKSRLQVYMAANPAPQIFPGIAASRGYWPFEDPVFHAVRKFMQGL
jgi:hypothetical protein